ncbi:hypothetical protein SLEP1_g19345 [Rubroshorea leprosula]|nr:hypothetical protein SLEP1_g19345 [Rubroshorea leprosula]
MDAKSGTPASVAIDQPKKGRATGSVQTQPRNSKTTKQTHPKIEKETEKAKATRGANKTGRPRGPSEHRAQSTGAPPCLSSWGARRLKHQNAVAQGLPIKTKGRR